MLNSHRRVNATSLLFLLLFVSLFCLNAKLNKSEKQRIDDAVSVVHELMDTPDNGIPTDIMDKAECIAVVPSVKKGAFIFGGQYGKGLVSCRRGGGAGWSAPLFFSVQGGSFGLQIGGQSIDLVLVVMNKRGIDHLLQDKFTLGADASVAAGPVGRSANAQTDAQLNAEILAYSRTKGVFAGLSLSGSAVKPDKDANRDLYGGDVAPKDVLINDKRDTPVETQLFVETMNKFSPVKK